jgi:hypothetical protein
MVIKYIKFYGERNSGVIKVLSIIKSNLENVEILSGNYTESWIHGQPLYNFSKKQCETLFICVINDLDKWLTLMFKNPYHILKKPFRKFICENTTNIDKRIDHDIYTNNFEKNKTLIELRYSKISAYYKLLKFKNCIVINLNYFINNQLQFYDIISKFNIKVSESLELINIENFFVEIIEYDKKLIKINNLIEDKINNLKIEYNFYDYHYNEYFDKIRNYIIKDKLNIINYNIDTKINYPRIFYITNNIFFSDFLEDTGYVFYGYNHFQNKYKTDIFYKLQINFLDVITYFGKYYDYKPLVIFNIDDKLTNKKNLLLNHLKKECYILNCDLCNNNVSVNDYCFNESNLTESSQKINKILNETLDIKKKFFNIFKDNINNFQLNVMYDQINFSLKLIKNERKNNFFLGLLTRCKNEKYVSQFVKYYFNQGVDKIIIIDDNSDDKTVYDSFINNKNVKIYFEKNIIINDITCKIYQKIKNDFEWLIFIDVDEYIKPMKNKTIKDELSTTFKYADIIKIPWIIMGFKNKVNYPDNIFIENTYRMNYDLSNKENNITCKSIFKPYYFDKISIKNNRLSDHYPLNLKNYSKLNIVNSVDNNKSLYDCFFCNLNEEKIKNSYLLCYHYRITCLQHIYDKIASNIWYKKYNFYEIISSNIIEKEDITMKNYALKEGL